MTWEHRKGPGVLVYTSLAASDRRFGSWTPSSRLGMIAAAGLSLKDDHGSEIVYTQIAGEKVRFSIRERYSQRRFDPATDGKDEEYRFLPPKVIREPNGLLVLDYGDWSGRDMARRPLRGVRTSLLDESLNEVICAVYWMIDDDHRHNEEARQREIARWNEQKAQVRRRAPWQEEQERVDRLGRTVDNWHKSRRIREFVQAVRDHHASCGSTIPDDGELGRYLRWADGVSDGLDPFKGEGRG